MNVELLKSEQFFFNKGIKDIKNHKLFLSTDLAALYKLCCVEFSLPISTKYLHIF